MKAAPRPFRALDGRPYEVRSAAAGDTQGLLDHRRTTIARDPDSDIPEPREYVDAPESALRQIRAAEKSQNSLLLVAAAPAIIGSLWLSGNGFAKTRHDTLLGMSVRREWRRQGVGGALLETAIEECRRSRVVRRISLTVFESNAPAIALYEKAGFRHEGRREKAVHVGGRDIALLQMGFLL